MTYDLIIRNGTIVDGLGGEPYVGDVAVRDDVIAAVGSVNGDGAKREIDATGLLVTPGFVDLHTHYDGQSIWSERLTPSSAHGVTTVVMGNCGVGFAPCRQEDHDVLVDVMAGVEDIPGVVMTDGLPWNWETLPVAPRPGVGSQFANTTKNARPPAAHSGMSVRTSPSVLMCTSSTCGAPGCARRMSPWTVCAVRRRQICAGIRRMRGTICWHSARHTCG